MTRLLTDDQAPHDGDALAEPAHETLAVAALRLIGLVMTDHMTGQRPFQ